VNGGRAAKVHHPLSESSGAGASHTHKNLSTITVVAVSNDVPLNHFCAKLAAALSAIRMLRVTPIRIVAVFFAPVRGRITPAACVSQGRRCTSATKLSWRSWALRYGVTGTRLVFNINSIHSAACMLMHICRVCQVFEGHSEYRLLSWLGEMEETHRIVIYETDKAVTPWTQRCVRQVHTYLRAVARPAF
jgi:hypothetical protein